MSQSNFSVQYHNFNPSSANREFIEGIIQAIQHELPGGATTRATFSLKDKVIKGMLQVGSYYGPFFSAATSDDLRSVTVKLVAQMRRRLEKFKSKRRSHDGLKESFKHYALSSEAVETEVVI